MKMMKKLWKQCRYLLEFGGVFTFYHICRFLPLALASAGAGAFAKWLGPKLGISHVARRNLSLALPELSLSHHENILKGMWENLGRTFAEYPHLSQLEILKEDSPVTVLGEEHLISLKKSGRPVIFFLGHLANWEYATMPARRWGFDMAQLFRPLNNPYVAHFITHVHKKIAPNLVTKGQAGARKMVEVLKKGGHLSMLIDQKLNEGIAIPFFGVPAMTAPALARLALRFQAFLVPVQVMRTHKHQCTVIYHPPLNVPAGVSEQEKIISLLTQANSHLEAWIRQHPADWLWLHKRWPRQEKLSTIMTSSTRLKP